MRTLFEMFCWTILLVMMICVATVHADTLKVGVIDTGLDLTDFRLSGHLCKEGHADFTNTGIIDNDGHGTHVVGLIEKYAKDSDYCLVILKFVNDHTVSSYLEAMKEAVAQHLDIVNMSLSGDEYSAEEERLICTNIATTFVVAAGNDRRNIVDTPSYPASIGCTNVISVGANDFFGSNYGDIIKAWETGYNVESTLPNGQYGKMTGTSMSTAIHTGKLIYERTHKKRSLSATF
jgi:major intracellular serine protease